MIRSVTCLIVIVLTAMPVRAAEPQTKIVVPVIGGGDAAAYASLLIDGETMRVDAHDLRAWADTNLSRDALARFDDLSRKDGTVPVGEADQAGFTITYDETQAALRLKVLPAALQTRALSLRQDNIGLGQQVIPAAALSGFINLRSGMDYVHEGQVELGRQPMRIDSDGAINLKSWVLEAQGDYTEDNTRPWQRGDVRLIRDWPDSMVRLAFGDLSYPVTGFQSFKPMAGISLARNFSLQPYRVTEPTGQTSFVITNPSRVDVFVNGQRVRSLQLEPGPYDLSDFPITDGPNDVRLLITDSTGRVEEKYFPLLSDQKLLKKGLHEYAYNIGIETETEDRDITYHRQKPVLSAFHRYGLTDTLTAGLSAQGDDDVLQLGSTLVNAFNWGTLALDGAYSNTADIGSGFATQLSYGYLDNRTEQNYALVVEYRSDDFSALGQDMPINPTQWEITSRYSQPVWDDINMNIGGRYRFGRDQEADDWSYNLDLNRVFYNTINANITLENRRIEGAGIMLRLSWTPLQSNHILSSSVDTSDNSQDARWSWYDNQHWQTDLGVRRDEDASRFEGSANYTGYRMEASARHDLARYAVSSMNGGGSNRWVERRTRVTAGTAIAFAGDHVALSRPIDSGFIMLTRHNNLTGHKLGVNPQTDADQETDYEAQIDALGPAVIPDAVPYMYRLVRIDVRNLPADYDVGQDQFTTKPSYKSGTVITIGNGANIYADGYIHLADGKPAGLQAGIIRNATTGNEQEFFTNQTGRFRISQLEPGAYTITLANWPEAPLTLTIDKDAKPGLFKAGTLTLAAAS